MSAMNKFNFEIIACIISSLALIGFPDKKEQQQLKLHLIFLIPNDKAINKDASNRDHKVKKSENRTICIR